MLVESAVRDRQADFVKLRGPAEELPFVFAGRIVRIERFECV